MLIRAMAERLQSPRDLYANSQFQFIATELDLALTFFHIAQSASDGQKAARNFANARRAYGGAMYFLENALLTSAERKTVFEKIERIMSLLASEALAQSSSPKAS